MGEPGIQFYVPGTPVIAVFLRTERHHKTLVGQIHLYRTHIHLPLQVHTEPLAGGCIGGAPPGTDVFIHRVGRAAALCGGAGCDRLRVREQHPFGSDVACIEFAFGDAVGVIPEILVAIQCAILIKSCRPQSHPALEIMIHTDPHGGGVPVVAVLVGDGAAMARSGGKAARLGRKGIAGLPGEGTKRTFAHIHAVGVGVVLGAGAGVLQVVFPLMLRHVRALDVGLADGKEHLGHGVSGIVAQLFHSGGEFNAVGFGVEHGFQMLIHHAVFPVYHAVVTGTLKAQRIGVSCDERLFFPDGLQSLRVQFNTPDRFGVGAAPVKVHPSVIVLKQVGVPERERRGHLNKGLGQRVGRAQNGAVHLPAAGAEVEILPDLAHIRRVVVDEQRRISVELPVEQVGTVPEPRRHGHEQIIPAFEPHQRGVGALPESGGALPFPHMLVAVIQIQRITIGLIHTSLHLLILL